MFKWSDDIWFWSDPHFFHAKCILSCERPFADKYEMNEALIENYNKLVGKNDLCLWTGDMFFCGITEMKKILERLNGRRRWWLGNHDWKNIKPRRAQEFTCEDIYKGFGVIDVEGTKINIGHFPYRGGGDKTVVERYHDERIDNDGSWLIHGHVHRAWKVRDRQINVGVDAWDFKPVHLSQIRQIIGV